MSETKPLYCFSCILPDNKKTRATFMTDNFSWFCGFAGTFIWCPQLGSLWLGWVLCFSVTWSLSTWFPILRGLCLTKECGLPYSMRLLFQESKSRGCQASKELGRKASTCCWSKQVTRPTQIQGEEKASTPQWEVHPGKTGRGGIAICHLWKIISTLG